MSNLEAVAYHSGGIKVSSLHGAAPGPSTTGTVAL